MRGFILIIVLIAMVGCTNDELTWLSVKNDTNTPIYAQPYSADFTNADWIQPGVSNDFYSINCDCLDGFTYFSHYYDSLVVIMEDYEDEPIKFYRDGTTINYNPELNPFINPDVWKMKDFSKGVDGSAFSSYGEKHIYEHYFCIREDQVKSLAAEN